MSTSKEISLSLIADFKSTTDLSDTPEKSPLSLKVS